MWFLQAIKKDKKKCGIISGREIPLDMFLCGHLLWGICVIFYKSWSLYRELFFTDSSILLGLYFTNYQFTNSLIILEIFNWFLDIFFIFQKFQVHWNIQSKLSAIVHHHRCHLSVPYDFVMMVLVIASKHLKIFFLKTFLLPERVTIPYIEKFPASSSVHRIKKSPEFKKYLIYISDISNYDPIFLFFFSQTFFSTFFNRAKS